MKAFQTFAAHPFGSWVVNGLAVVAFILVLKMLVSRLPKDGPVGAVRAGVEAV